MSTLTIRLPDEKHERRRQLARHRQISLNKLIEELATVVLAEFDAEARFRARAAMGSREEGLRLLAKERTDVWPPETMPWASSTSSTRRASRS